VPWFHDAVRLTRGKKIALALATAWPPLYMILFLGVFMLTFLNFATMTNGAGGPKHIPTPFLVLFPLHALTMLLGIGLLVIYVLHALQNEKLDQNTRVLWAVLIFVGNYIAMPIYFYKYVLPLQDDAG
jgi:hypothetical protein